MKERYILMFLCLYSAGKSFVAEILMLRRVVFTGKMAMLVLPYVSICAEKVIFFPYFLKYFFDGGFCLNGSLYIHIFLLYLSLSC